MGLPTRKVSNLENSTSKNKALPLKTAQTNKPENSSITVVVKPVVVNVFFDGTKNNLYNIYNKAKYAKQIAEDKDAYESYTNAYSNIAHLFRQRYGESKDNIWIYIQGMGSTKDEEDSKAGFAYGSGDTGVKTRAESAFAEIKKAYNKLNGEKNAPKPSSIMINVFGFSRGAATARHFVHLAKSKPKLFKGWGFSSKQVRFRFVGIFDTVSSFQTIDAMAAGKVILLGPIIGAGSTAVKPNFDNDVKELTLNFTDFDADDKKITKVFHIAAGDEYREYFSLTNIMGAMRDKYGYEVVMDGAHSDIGGSYPSGLNDSYHITTEALKEWFIDKGFYTAQQIHSVGKNEYNAVRKNIPNDYHKIALRTMRFMTQEYGKIQFKSSIEAYENKGLTGILKNLIASHPMSVFNTAAWGQVLDLRLKDQGQVRSLRNQYLHWSAKKTYDGGMTEDLGYSIRLKNGLPYRKIHNG
ncbi:MAG: phospholipase effector Tle1 domain-containing protein [Acinetobacter guillouiae]|uniref:phospholipase effector Tle1 domain-containing protein n=1 Tax=Acinetobacter guillouiae TaxID=106649 RepID=UPI003AF7580E